jgi:hypothetical protein
MRRPVLVVAAALVFALAACSDEEPEVEGDLDASAQTACDEVAAWSADGYPEEDRVEVLTSIAAAAGDSSVEEIKAASDEIAAAADGSPTAYEVPLDELASACMDLGWEGANG